MSLPTPDDVAAAARRIAPHVVRTPILRSAALDRATGATVLLKPEPLQRTGSFKLRGATNALRSLPESARAGGVVAHSSGNHAQAIACAAASLGMRATICMPADAPLAKVEGTRSWGAEIVRYDRRRDDREAMAAGLAAKLGATLIPPFEHPDVIAGQGTATLELLEDAAAAGLRLDRLLVCCGGGGLIAGAALAVEGFAPGVAIHPVEPAGWDDTARSLVAGERLGNDGAGSMLCDALLSPRPGALTFAINGGRLAAGLVVTDAEVFAAMRFAFLHLKVVVEPGGAVALAALLAGKMAVAGQVVGCILSGGNVDADVFAQALGSQTPH